MPSLNDILIGAIVGLSLVLLVHQQWVFWARQTRVNSRRARRYGK